MGSQTELDHYGTTGGDAADQDPGVILVDPSTGSLPAGGTDTVAVSVADAVSALSGAGNYELLIRLANQDGVLVVPLVLESVALPVPIASEPPNPSVARPEYAQMTSLDFGQTDAQKEFYVVNIGPIESKLYFKIVHDDQGVEEPLIVDVQPVSGQIVTRQGDVFFIPGTNDMVDAVRVVVTVDRSVMNEDVEYRDLTSRPGTRKERSGSKPWSPGAWNCASSVLRCWSKARPDRSRPPSDALCISAARHHRRAIPTRTAEDLEIASGHRGRHTAGPE